ncbi:MAG: DUF4340 domain-containing protein, partial [Phycisphaerae bacterium]
RLVRDGARWRFEADDAPAEADVVDELLTAIDDLRAVAFVDAASVEPAALGLDDPQVGIRLTIPGAPEVERITVGRYTDERLKRLVYVRRNEATSIAKVRAKSVAALLRGPTAYRDRTVFSFPANRIERVALDIENRFADGRMQLAFERADDMWRMVEPVAAPVRADRIKALVDGLASLRAEAVVGAAAELSAYGLQTPSATVTFTYKPPVEFRVEPAPAPDKDADPASDNDAESAPDQSGAPASAATSADTDAPDASQTGSGDVPDAEDAETGDNKIKMVPVQVQPPSQHYALAVAESGGKVYAKRSDLGTIFRLTDTFAKRLFDEYRMTAVLDFDDADVVRFSIESGDTAYTFVRADDQWTLDAEPDLPLDQNKIKNLLLQLKDLRTDRYVVYGARDLPGFGLAPAARRVTVTMKDDSVVALLVSDKTCDADPSGGHYAVLQGRTNVFLLAPSTVRRFAVSLDDLERSD